MHITRHNIALVTRNNTALCSVTLECIKNDFRPPKSIQCGHENVNSYKQSAH